MNLRAIFRRRKGSAGSNENTGELLSATKDAMGERRQDENCVAQNTDKIPVEASRAMDDHSFDEVKNSIVKRNESLEGKYDEIARHLKSVMEDPLPKEIEQTIARLKTDYDEMRAKVSEDRRLGKDVLIPTLILKQFPPKLKLSQATRNMDDVMKAELVLKQARFELSQAKEIKEMNVKKEVYAMAGLDDDGSTMDRNHTNNDVGVSRK